MSNMKKTDAFFDKVSAAGLDSAFGKMSTIASETIGVYLEDLMDDAVAEMERPVCRVRYEQKPDGSEAYIFEERRFDEDEYEFAVLYPLVNDMISFQALTQIRQYLKMGYQICFA